VSRTTTLLPELPPEVVERILSELPRGERVLGCLRTAVHRDRELCGRYDDGLHPPAARRSATGTYTTASPRSSVNSSLSYRPPLGLWSKQLLVSFG
jgi:hypothetical protein